MTSTRLHLVPQTVPPTPAEGPGKPAKAPRAKRRTGHRGVKLLKPTGTKSPYWRASWVDLDTGKRVYRPLGEGAPSSTPEAAASNGDLRRDYAIAKRRELDKRLGELRAGSAPRRSADMLISDAIDRYFTGRGALKRDQTREEYRRGCDWFLEWCALPAVQLRTVRELSKGVLRAYAGHRAAVPLDPGSGRTGPRAPSTINKELRWLSAVLGELRKLELIHLTRDDIADGLERFDELITKRDFHRSAALRAILDCCRRHDAADPYDGDYSGRVFGVVLFILLTGLRAAEALGIEWRDIEVDDDGHPLIKVRAEVSKTGRERTIYTEHSPLLATLISAPNDRTGTILGGSENSLFNVRQRLINEHGAPAFDWQELRCTCGTYLTCAPAIFGDAAPYMSAKQLGHSVAIAEKHYTGVVKVSREAGTTEAAMQLEITLDACPRL